MVERLGEMRKWRRERIEKRIEKGSIREDREKRCSKASSLVPNIRFI